MKDNSEEYRQDLQRRVRQDPVKLETDAAMWDKVIGEIEAAEKPERRIRMYWYASAAAVFIALTSGLIYFYSKGNSVNNQQAKAEKIRNNGTEIITITKIDNSPERPSENSVGVKKESGKKAFKEDVFQTKDKTELYKLADGSEITLNISGDLNLKTDTENNINIDLSGEAYFDVVHGLKRSFRVNFGASGLEVIGTKFSVRNHQRENSQEVLVSEGIVKVTVKGSKEILLRRGSFLKIDKNTGLYEVKNVNPGLYLSWKTGKLDFAETSMTEVAAVLSRVYNTEVEIENNIKSCTFTGDLSKMTLEEALTVITATTSTEIKRNGDHVKISGAPCD
jgi:transmembrane sensor